MTPNTIVYNSIISGVRNMNNMEAALKLHKEMINSKIQYDLQIYTSLIGGLLKRIIMFCFRSLLREAFHGYCA